MIEMNQLVVSMSSSRWVCTMVVESSDLLGCKSARGRRGAVHRSRGKAGCTLGGEACGRGKQQRLSRGKYRIE